MVALNVYFPWTYFLNLLLLLRTSANRLYKRWLNMQTAVDLYSVLSQEIEGFLTQA